MNILVDDLARAVLKKPVDDCSLDELRRLCQQYPYFGPLHVIFSQKLKLQDDQLLNTQVQKTSLYFTNPLWLDYLFSEPATVVKSFQENLSAREERPISAFEEISEIIDEPEEAESIDTETIHIAEQTVELGNNVSLPDPVEEIEETPGEITNEKIEDGPPENFQEMKETEPVEMPSLADKFKFEPVDPTTSPIVFEPFHTVDYFASQGIKPKEENKPADRFSQQLKSFTEWLKTMKKIPVTEIENTTDKTGETKVEQMAAQSITDREVVTEAMAEVWEKQGELVKAKEIYRKLSLLDPTKSTYFAAKIEALK